MNKTKQKTHETKRYILKMASQNLDTPFCFNLQKYFKKNIKLIYEFLTSFALQM